MGELRDLFAEYAELLYGSGEKKIGLDGGNDGAAAEEILGGIEDEITAEVAEMKQPAGIAQLFTPIRVDVQCGVYEFYAAHANGGLKLTRGAYSCLLQDSGAGGASELRQTNLRRRDEPIPSQADEICETPVPHDFDGQGVDGGSGEARKGSLGATLSSVSASAPKGASAMLTRNVGS